MELTKKQLIAFARLCIIASGHGLDSNQFLRAYEEADEDVQEAFDQVRDKVESDPDFAL
jgi:hypothetical protein